MIKGLLPSKMFDRMATSVTDSDPCKSYSHHADFFKKGKRGLERERENDRDPVAQLWRQPTANLDDHVTIRPPYIFIIFKKEIMRPLHVVCSSLFNADQSRPNRMQQQPQQQFGAFHLKNKKKKDFWKIKRIPLQKDDD